MKTLNKAILALGISSVLAVSANAAITYGSLTSGQPYVGLKAGQIDIDGVPGKATAYGIYGGYNFDQNLGVEVEYIDSKNKNYTTSAGSYKADAKTYGIYGTYRYNFNNTPVYAKGKLGLAKTDVEKKQLNGASTVKSNTTGLAGGVAVGFNATPNVSLEAGFNYLDSNANMGSVGAHLKF
ncbi:porin family protein [Moraxella haemolytica]|uniref:porin family protein n=1 Tax=Moraxella haemolytica TaxID=2904119 RepID=UPI002543B974|nr:porin family protein [Moraxella sp. ZY171148]WII95535.1 porin family protein [Moraxella sp. ZY171148]